MTEKLLSVRDLKTYFYTDDGVIPAVDGVSFELDRGHHWHRSVSQAVVSVTS